jgi:glycosyltransferase involved in cell wall biosynthesis
MSPTPQSVYLFTDTDGYGGAEKALLTLVEGFDRRRWKPTLVYHAGDGVVPLLDAARAVGAELWAVPPMPEGRAGAARVPRFVAALRARRPAVFHAHLNRTAACKFGLAAAVLARVPAVVGTQHLFFDFRLTTPSYLQQRALGAAIGRYIAVSRHVERSLRDAFRLPASKVVVVPNGIDSRRFRCEPDPSLRAALSREGSRHVVLTTTRLVAQKGLSFLLEAAPEIPDVQIVIAGDGPEQTELATRARDLGLADRVDFLGHRDDVPQLLACSDVVVLPSLNEGLPLAALEAMSAEKPVVATLIGGTDEAIVNGKTGLLVPPGDPGALAGAIRRLLSDPGLAASMGRAGRTLVEESFSCVETVERVTRVYSDLLPVPLTSVSRRP